MEASRWAPTSSTIPPTSYGQDTTPFAQTGGEASDLFSDDFTPIAKPVSQPVPPEAPRADLPQTRSTRGDRDARRARTRARGGRAVPPPIPSNEADAEEARVPIPATAESANDPPAESVESAKATSGSTASGDRRKTGGLTRPRLTEEELSAKLEAARLNSARREEAHRAAEADEASFRAQEAQAQERRREDTMNRKKMEAEREKNRARKLAGRGGREWDEGKEDETASARGRGYRRGVHGAVSGLAASSHSGEVRHDQMRRADGESHTRSGRPRGDYNARSERGGRGRGRGRGGGGDGFHQSTGAGEPSGRALDLGDTDFPALGGTRTDTTTTVTEEQAGGIQAPVTSEEAEDPSQKLIVPPTSGRTRHTRSPWRVAEEQKTSWADQVEEGG